MSYDQKVRITMEKWADIVDPADNTKLTKAWVTFFSREGLIQQEDDTLLAGSLSEALTARTDEEGPV